ncbi:MAG: FAD-dependent oxidoreductase [Bdellovibrionota bacterium]
MTLHRQTPHIVVIGAGYAGLPCALRLSRHKDLRITLVNPDVRQELTCDLYRTLRTGKPYTFAFTKLVARRGIRFVESRVTRIDPEKKILELRGLNQQAIPYDALVVATGVRSVAPSIEGLEELQKEDKESLSKRIFQFKKTTHVQELRTALSRIGWKPELRESRDRFVVVLGAGSTGIEVAGELANLRAKNKRCRIILLDESTSLLREFSPVARKLFKKRLNALRIECVLGSPAQRITSEELHLHNGQVIPWDLLVLCTGARRAASWISGLGNAEYHSGLVVDSNFEIKGHPCHYAIGDVARYTLESTPLKNPSILAKRAQFAVQSGIYLANLLPIVLKGPQPDPVETFRPLDLGYLVTLGPDDGIGRVGPQPASRLARWASPFIQGRAVDKLKNLVRVRYLLTLKREGYNPFTL